VIALLIITLVMVALYMGLMQFYAWGWIFTPLFEAQQAYQPTTKVTVIVPARNEAPNLPQLLPCLLAQNYPAHLLEVLVVDDHSEDGTAEAASALGVYVLPLPAGLLGKKAAIAHGVAHASGQLIITTDADCTMGPDWVSTIAQYYETHPYKVLTGPVAFREPVAGEGSNKLLYYFQSLDLMGLMFITAGSLRFKFPHMANGANFAFEKRLFMGLGGYSGIDSTPTGDDILFLLKAHSHHPGCAGFIKANAAIVATGAAPTWSAFWQQRLRWVSKSAGFNDARLTAVLAFYYLYALAMVAAGIGMFFNLDFFLPFFGLLFGKLLPELVMLAHAAAFFGKLRHLVWFLPSQLLHVYYVLRIGLQSQLKRYDWKGRKYGG